MASDLSHDKLVVYLPMDRDDQWIAKVHAKYPKLDIQWCKSEFGSGPQPLSSFDANLWKDTTMLLSTWLPPPEELLRSVRFCQLTSAGTNKWKGHAVYENRNVVFCNSSGIHPPQIAEWVVATWLAHQHHLYMYHDNMKKNFWQSKNPTVQDSYGRRVGILGYGSIGRQCARLCQAMGMEVYAYTHSARATPASRKDHSDYQFDGIGDPDGTVPARWFHGAAKTDIHHFLAQDLDLLVVSLPLTEASHHLLGAAEFAILADHRKTFVSNIGRGPIIDTTALITALESGQIRGAALDVTDPEPLPEDHALWKAPNLFVSPHVSWLTESYWERNLDILDTNLDRLAKGERCINEVDRTKLH